MYKPIPRMMEVLKDAPLSPDGYHNFVFHFDEEHYRTRVQMAGFTGAKKVLDAGCGYGQWAVALADFNDYVIGIDKNPSMVDSAAILCKSYGITNIDIRQDELPHLSFPDEQFDLIWCWSVFMFVNREETLCEFNRLLKPGGRFLIGCCNSRGRWLYKMLSSWNPFNFRYGRFKKCLKTFLYGDAIDARPNYTSIKQCAEICERFGFRLITADYDGHIDLTGQDMKRSMFSPRFLFLENNIEFIGEKIKSIV